MTDELKSKALPQGLSARYTSRFFSWERRGRGWFVFPHYVDLEPPFERFSGHGIPLRKPIDDVRKESAMGAIWNGLKTMATRKVPMDNADATQIKDAGPMAGGSKVMPFSTRHHQGGAADDLMEIGVISPPDQRITAEIAEQFLINIATNSSPIAFEIIGTAEVIYMQVTCRFNDMQRVQQQITAYFPESTCEIMTKALQKAVTVGKKTVVIDWGLAQEMTRPLRIAKSFEADPLIGIIGSLEGLGRGEVGVLQVLFQAVKNPWAASIIKANIDDEGRPFFADAPEAGALAKEKVKGPLFAAVIRTLGQSDKKERAWEIVRALGSGLRMLADPQSNELLPLDNKGYDDHVHHSDVISRKTHRSGMIISSRELVTLVHFPSASVRSKKLKRRAIKTKEAPAISEGHQLIIGVNTHQGKEKFVTLGIEQRLRHSVIAGATGTGKSSLAVDCIRQDAEHGFGLAFFDFHGDASDQVLALIPQERYDDVVLFDPSDEEYPIGLNLLSTKSEIEKTWLTSDLTAIVRRFSIVWGDQLENVLSSAIGACISNERIWTFIDLHQFLTDQRFRREVLQTVTDPQIAYFWQKEFPLLIGKPLGPVLTRLNSFLRPKIIRNILGQTEGINFEEIINNGKIFLIKLPLGLIGEENSYTLGALILAKLQQSIWARQSRAVATRTPFFLYIDECQNLITPSLASLLSSSRKFGVGIVLAHQDLRQLWERDKEVANSVISNTSIRITFNLGDFDAKKLEDGYSFFKAQDIQNLGVGEAIARIERRDYDFNLRTFPPAKIDPDEIARKRQRLLQLSRKKYGTPREVIEASLAERKAWSLEPLISLETKPKKAPGQGQPKKKTTQRKNNEIAKAGKEEDQASAPMGSDAYPDLTVLEGKGGYRHRYIQAFIKKMAEEHGYKAVIEQPLPDGFGSVDLGIEKGEQRIAIEVSVTTEKTQELKNIKKCLTAGYEEVILVSVNDSTLAQVRTLIDQNLNEVDRRKIFLLKPEDVLLHLQKYGSPDEGAGKLKGYRINVLYPNIEKEAEKKKREIVSQVIRKSIEKEKG